MADLADDLKKKVQGMDSKMKDTLQWSIIYTAVVSAVAGLLTQASFYYMNPAGGLLRQYGSYMGMGGGVGVMGMVSAAVSGLIGGAISGLILGFILAYWYPQIMNLQRKYLKDYLDSLFKLLFYPYVVFSLLGFLMRIGSPMGFSLASLVTLVASIAVCYVYSKMLAKKLAKWYA